MHKRTNVQTRVNGLQYHWKKYDKGNEEQKYDGLTKNALRNEELTGEEEEEEEPVTKDG